MNKKSLKERADIIRMLVEGNSLRATSRLADCSINTVTKLLELVGVYSEVYQEDKMRNLTCKRIQVDEIWSFVYARRGSEAADAEKSRGDIWTFTALCPDTKIVPSWFVGPRDKHSTLLFMQDLAGRLGNRVQLTADGFRPYKEVVEKVFGDQVDFGSLVKQYGEARGKRLSGPYQGALKEATIGKPDMERLTTAHVERQNLNMRMSISRFGRKTNAFSKKIDNHCNAVSLHFMHYNFVRLHKTLRVTPAMEAGISDHVMSWEEIISDMDDIIASPLS